MKTLSLAFLFGLLRAVAVIVAALWLSLLGGCQSGFRVNRVTHDHPRTAAEAARLVAEWRAGGPANIAIQAGGKTRSMGAAINAGDWLLCTRYNGGRIPVGVFAVFKNPESPTGLTCHRVLEDNGAAAFISGDANRYSDGWVAHDRITALVWRVVHFSP